jgi:ankyrin repeat protein
MATESFPSRPDLDQLRRRAKDLAKAARQGDPAALARLADYRRPGAPITLALAQLALAREFGFPSWPRLKEAVEASAETTFQRVSAFLLASVQAHFEPGTSALRRAARLLDYDPAIATYDIRTAAVLGEPAYVRSALERDPSLAVLPDKRLGWPPLLFACNSRWHQIEPRRSAGIVDVARLLLDAGASPDTTIGRAPRPGHCSALYAAAGLANHRALARLLLDRGADPDTPAALYHSAFHRDHETLGLLLERGARAEGLDALAAAISVNDAEAVRLLLGAGIDPREPLPAGALGASYEGRPSIPPVYAAIEFDCSLDLIQALLQGGADPTAAPAGGRSPYREARRRGRAEVAAMLVAQGAVDDAGDTDTFLDACARADRKAAQELLRRHPDLLAQLTDEDHAALVDAADHGRLEAVRLMVDLGFPLETRGGEDGATPLQAAAASGSVDVVRLLIEEGADIEAPDATWQSSPLVWASVGSGFKLGHAADPDWVATVQAFIDCGASLANAWVPGKPPSAEVAELLIAQGVRQPVGSGRPDATPG